MSCEFLHAPEVPESVGVVAARMDDERVLRGRVGQDRLFPRLLHVGKQSVARFLVGVLVVRAGVFLGGRIDDEEHQGNARAGLLSEQFDIVRNVHLQHGYSLRMNEDVRQVHRATR